MFATYDNLLWHSVWELKGPCLLKLSTWFCSLRSQPTGCQVIPPILQALFFTVPVTLCFLSLYLVPKRLKKALSHKKPYPASVIQAISVTFTPVSVAWPRPFISFFESTIFRDPQSIELDILGVIGHICAGHIELRDSNDLSRLFQDKLLVYGLKVKAYMKTLWWFKTTIWISAQLINPFPSPKSDDLAYLPPSAVIGNWPKATVDLDSVSCQNIKSVIFRIQSTLQPGASITVDFSCLSDQVNFLTFDFLLCAIPFLPYLSGQKKGCNKTRKATPLFISLQEIISLVSLRRVRIDSVQNISLEHAGSLLTIENNLVQNRTVRMAHIAKVGIQGWREDRLMLLWEAGLLGSGLLTRWRIKLIR